MADEALPADEVSCWQHVRVSAGRPASPPSDFILRHGEDPLPAFPLLSQDTGVHVRCKDHN